MREDRVLFLDCDGVLNSDATTECINGWTFVDDELIARLKKIIDATDAKIVLSSDWRFCATEGYDGPANEDPRPVLTALHKKLADYGMKISDTTRMVYSDMQRGYEIYEWLRQHPEVKRFAILDDMASYRMFPVQDNFVRTAAHFGLMDEDVERAINIIMIGENE